MNLSYFSRTPPDALLVHRLVRRCRGVGVSDFPLFLSYHLFFILAFSRSILAFPDFAGSLLLTPNLCLSIRVPRLITRGQAPPLVSYTPGTLATRLATPSPTFSLDASTLPVGCPSRSQNKSRIFLRGTTRGVSTGKFTIRRISLLGISIIRRARSFRSGLSGEFFFS